MRPKRDATLRMQVATAPRLSCEGKAQQPRPHSRPHPRTPHPFRNLTAGSNLSVNRATGFSVVVQ